MNTIVIVAVVVGATALFFLMDAKGKKKKEGGSSKKPSSKKQKNAPIQDFLPIERIEDSYLVLKGDKYRQIIEVGNINPYALSNNEKRSVRDHFRTMLTMFRSPFQFVVRGRKMDLSDWRQYFQKTYQETAEKWDSEQLLRYGRMIEEHLVEQGNKQRTIRENLFVVGSEPGILGEKDLEEVKRMLDIDMENAVSGLKRCQITAKPMNDMESVESLQLFWNRDRLHARAREAVQYDAMRGYHIGAEEFVAAGKEK